MQFSMSQENLLSIYYVPRVGMDAYGKADLLWFPAPLDNVIWAEMVK